jgi:hypothetical protein
VPTTNLSFGTIHSLNLNMMIIFNSNWFFFKSHDVNYHFFGPLRFQERKTKRVKVARKENYAHSDIIFQFFVKKNIRLERKQKIK